MNEAQREIVSKSIHKTSQPHATAYICRELDLTEGDGLLVVESERHVLLDCRQRFITDVLSAISLRDSSTLQLEDCELRGFEFSGSSDVSGGTILVQNSRMVISNCTVCPHRSTTYPANPNLEFASSLLRVLFLCLVPYPAVQSSRPAPGRLAHGLREAGTNSVKPETRIPFTRKLMICSWSRPRMSGYG